MLGKDKKTEIPV